MRLSSRSFARILLILPVAVAFWAGTAAADDGDIAKGGRRWAILIGVDKYEHATHLRFTTNDVEQLVRTLKQRDGFTDDCILQIVDTAPQTRLQPLKASIEKELPNWLEQVAAGDEVLVYFSGHGFKDAGGKLYLAPLDGDPNKPAETLIPIQWFRDRLNACKARTKLLILDACHAGGEKGAGDPRTATSKELTDAFPESEGVVTIASCDSGQSSLMWEEMQQSLFSFWLNQALKGHADANGDGRIDGDELYKFMMSNVAESAQAVYGFTQTPVRNVSLKTHDTPIVVKLKSSTLKGVLDDMAEQLARVIAVKRLSPVGVAAFQPQTTNPKFVDLLRNESGALGDICGAELQRRLTLKAKGAFQVLDYESLKKSLSREGLTARDLRTSAASGLTSDGQGVAAIGMGAIVLRSGCTISLQCRLMNAKTQEELGLAAGTADLEPDEWATLGHSAEIHVVDRYHDESENQLKIRDAESQDMHPLDPQRLQAEGRAKPKFNVKIFVNNEQRTPKFVGKDAYVSLRKGEVYRIEIETGEEVKEPLFLRLLVDGLNTLPERPPAKMMEVEAKAEKPPYRAAQRVNPVEARAWRLDADKRQRWSVPGFFSKIGDKQKGEESQYNEFLVTDAANAAASRQRYTDQIGLITAAFYRPVAKDAAKSVGSTLGKLYNVQTDEYDGNEVPGALIEVINLRYVEP
jgi:hypothetical protein